MANDYTKISRNTDNTKSSDQKVDLMELKIQPSTIETVDGALVDWLDNRLNIHTTTNSGWKKTPVLWVTPERAFQVKNNELLRDSNGNLKLPLITVNRTGITKDPTFKGVAWANLPEFQDVRGGALRIGRVIDQKETSQLAAVNSVRRGVRAIAPDSKGPGQKNSTIKNGDIIYQEYWIPIPVSVAINYEVSLRSEYQQQMNQMLQPFLTKTGQIWVDNIFKDGHRFEVFIQQDFSHSNNVSNMGEEERMYQTKVQLKILAHLIGEGENRDKPLVSKRKTFILSTRVVEREGKLKT